MRCGGVHLYLVLMSSAYSIDLEYRGRAQYPQTCRRHSRASTQLTFLPSIPTTTTIVAPHMGEERQTTVLPNKSYINFFVYEVIKNLQSRKCHTSNPFFKCQNRMYSVGNTNYKKFSIMRSLHYEFFAYDFCMCNNWLIFYFSMFDLTFLIFDD
jgi:hypothetical protein